MTPPTRRAQPRASLRYRRAPHVVSYWLDGALVLHNYASNVRAEVAPMAIELLARCGEWSDLDALAEVAGVPEGFSLQPFVDVLVEATFLERSDRPEPAASRAYAQWNGWNPHAAFFHAATKDVSFVPPEVADAKHRKKAISRSAAADGEAREGRIARGVAAGRDDGRADGDADGPQDVAEVRRGAGVA